ncbi:hypothetical protein ACWDTQ_23080 [Streptomyces cellulosae]
MQTVIAPTYGRVTDLTLALPAFENMALPKGTWIVVVTPSAPAYQGHVFPVAMDRGDGLITILDGDRPVPLARGEYRLVLPGVTPVDWA